VLGRLASSSGWFVAAVILLLASMASSLGGCSAETATDGVDGGVGGALGGTGGSYAGGGSGGTGATVPMLQFTEPGALSLPRRGPGDKPRELTVQLFPTGIHTVRFALLPASETMLPGDAALNATDLLTSEDGRVTVELTAPSAPTSFLVRASAEGYPSATLEVTVPRTGKADLRVEPDYDGGRQVTNWYAAAAPDRTCPLEDDDLDWVSSTGAVELHDLPADTQLAVVMRAEHFARGCVTISGVVEGVDNRVTVPVTNVKIQLAASEVSISFDFAEFQTAFRTAAEPSIQAALSAVGGGADDATALLDRMQDEAGADEASFVAARGTGAWDAAVRTALGTGAATALRAPLERWLRAGLANTSAGRFVGTLGAAGDDPEGAALTLETVAGLPPDALGVSEENDATWYSSPPLDEVFFGSTLAIDPSVLLLGGALAPARTEVDGAETVAEALAQVLSCDAVATELVARGAAAGVSYVGCDASCTRSLCADALVALVEELEARDEPEGSSLELAAAASATVGADAELVGLDGTWVGTITHEGEETGVGGVVLAPAP